MKITKVLRFIGIVIQLLVFVPFVFAAPEIRSVTGNVVTGQTITISGSGMMDLNTTNWLNDSTKASFEGASDFTKGSFNTDGWAWNVDSCSANKNAEYVSDTKLVDSKAAYLLNDCCACPVSTQSCCGNRLLTYLLEGKNEGYIAGYFRYSGQWPTGYMKFLIGQSGSSDWYFQPWTWSNNKVTGYFLRDQGTSTVISTPYAIGLNEWHHFELRLKYSSPKTFQAWIDGQLIGSITPVGSSISWVEIGFPNLAGLYSPDWVGLHLDMLTISTGRVYPASKIVVSNSSTYGSGVMNWQEPVFLSDTSIQVKVNLAGLGVGPYYLWVTNNKQEHSAGYPLSGGGGGGGEELPSAPTGLRVIN